MIDIRNMRDFGAITFITLLLGACGVEAGLGKLPSARQTLASQENNAGGSSLSTLPPREMNTGECAVFLWSEENSRPLVYVQNIATDQSTMLIDRKSVELARNQASEMIIPGFYARQVFTANNVHLSVRLRPDAGRNLYEGIKIPSGILTVRRDDQSENIMSVSGLLGCNIGS